VLNEIGLLHEPLSKEISFLAGKAFLRYRQNGGNKTSPLPDFFIGAHASHENYSTQYLKFSKSVLREYLF
jgi:predicted nucleic acid-binding protein